MLVHTDGNGVERITEHGVVVAGKEHELDSITFASGFDVDTSFTHRAGSTPPSRRPAVVG
jgi:cyclohexanone monooxygenase